MLPETHAVLGLLEGGFGHLKVLVVGDLMLDRYILGEVDRISPGGSGAGLAACAAL